MKQKSYNNRWIFREEKDPDDYFGYYKECPDCAGEVDPTIDGPVCNYDFCPFCGAKMRTEDEA